MISKLGYLEVDMTPLAIFYILINQKDRAIRKQMIRGSPSRKLDHGMALFDATHLICN